MNTYCSCRLAFALKHIKSQEVPTGKDTNVKFALDGIIKFLLVSTSFTEFKKYYQNHKFYGCVKGCAEAFDSDQH